MKDLQHFFNSSEKSLDNFNVIPLLGINFAVLFRCLETENSTSHEELFILSRDEVPETIAVHTTELVLRNFGFRAPTVKVDQSECREQRRREKIMQRSSIRQFLVAPDADYIASIRYELCVGRAKSFEEFVFCMEQYYTGRFMTI